jgi:beta-glucosidase
LLGGSAAEVALRTQQLQSWARIPLFIAADVEEGVGQRFAGASWLPPPLAFGSIATVDLAQGLADVETFGQITAQEARAIGLNWILAPVVDVNNNPLNPVINVRSFGETPEGVCALTQAFLRGCHGHSVLTTAKHFPGHGDTAVDSHLELPQILHDRSRLEAVEWKPFRAAIEAGVSSIMTAHLLLPALDADYPATLSRKILTNLLREAWGFEGLIVTDALIMQAITQHYGETEAPLLALEAGADVILMPVNPTKTIESMVAAVQSGRLSETRIDQSLARIWNAKRSIKTIAEPIAQRLDSLERSPGDTLTRSILKRSQRIRCSSSTHPVPNPLSNQVSDSRSSQLDDQPADRQADQSPEESSQSPKLPNSRNLILVDNLLQVPFLGNHTPAVRIPQEHGYRLQILDQTSHSLPQNVQLNTQSPHIACPTLLQLFVRGNPFRGSGETSPWMQQWLMALLEVRNLQALIVYGSPYAWESLIAHFPAEIPSIFTYGQMPLAQEIALQSVFDRLFEPGLGQNKVSTLNPIEFTT